MKFIFPQNYNFNSKILGLIEYSAAILDLLWGGIVFLIINTFFHSISAKIFVFIIFVFPVLIFSVVGVQGENLIYFLTYMVKYFLKQKLFFYEKSGCKMTKKVV